MTDLEKALYDVASNKIQPEKLENSFDEIAIRLLQQTKLVAYKSEYLIREIEFYFSNEGFYNHQDPYTHYNQYSTKNVKRQGEFGEWYFHRFKSSVAYKKQKFRGLDISFGNMGLKNFGGILIRKIQATDQNQIIKGISNVVGEIINKIQNTESHLDSIATSTGKLVFDNSCVLHLQYSENHFNSPIYKATRVIPKQKGEEKFYSKHYRYFNYPEIKLVKL